MMIIGQGGHVLERIVRIMSAQGTNILLVVAAETVVPHVVPTKDTRVMITDREDHILRPD